MSDDDKPSINLVDLSAKRQQRQQGSEMQALVPVIVHNECLRRELAACVDAVNAARFDIPGEKLLSFHVALMRVQGGVSDLTNLLNAIAEGDGDAA